MRATKGSLSFENAPSLKTSQLWAKESCASYLRAYQLKMRSAGYLFATAGSSHRSEERLNPKLVSVSWGLLSSAVVNPYTPGSIISDNKPFTKIWVVLVLLPM